MVPPGCTQETGAQASDAQIREALNRMHRSRLSALVLDCPLDDLDAAAKFWSAALGRKVATLDQDGDGKYAELETAADEPFLLLQKVEHEARLHLDIETDNIDAEVARL